MLTIDQIIIKMRHRKIIPTANEMGVSQYVLRNIVHGKLKRPRHEDLVRISEWLEQHS